MGGGGEGDAEGGGGEGGLYGGGGEAVDGDGQVEDNGEDDGGTTGPREVAAPSQCTAF